MPLKLLRFATILLVALLSGLAFAHVLEQPAKMQYDAALCIALQVAALALLVLSLALDAALCGSARDRPE